jgi:hypothetical protein
MLAALAVALAGCGNTPPDQVAQPTQTPARSARAGGAGAGHAAAPAAPHAQGAQGESSSEAPSEEQIATLQEAYDKNPSDATAKTALVSALVEGGDYFMYTDEVDRKVKYRKALALYRRAVKLDPENKTAREGIDQIETIYKSMNLPIPEV